MIDAALVWPDERAADATRALAEAAGLMRAPAPAPASGVPEAAIALGIDAEPRDLGGVPSVRDDLRQALAQGPLLVRLPAGNFAAFLRVGRRHATVVGPSGLARVPLTAVEDTLWAAMDGDRESLDSLRVRLTPVLPGRRALEAARLLVASRKQTLAEAWVLRPRSSTLRDALRRRHAGLRAAAIATAYIAEMLVFVGIWRHVGAEALAGGRSSGAVLFALLAAWTALQLGAATAVRRLALDVGAVVRVWLLRGALRLDPEHIRDAGVGQLLGRALDAESLDALALGGGVEALAGLFEVGFATVVLALGLGPAATLSVLAVAALALGLLARAQARRHAAWSQERRALTHDLVERMVGHRTLLAQDDPIRRAAGDEDALGTYEARTGQLDHLATWSEIGLPRSFLIVSLAAIGATLASASSGAVSMAAVATSLGGIWLAYSGLRRLGAALGDLIAARDAWARVRPLVGAPDESPATSAAPTGTGAPVLIAQDIGYRYPRRPRPQLEGVSLTLSAGERYLIAGPSGAGKSTLGALLTGLKAPTTGRLLLHGADQSTLGLSRWRRAVGAVPQFHENHVFSADLLFNLLLGRRWPPRPEDITLAETVCRELGLGPLLARMPAGLQQLVGETGWQLSHGERSRLYVARSLLQTLDARVLDESFGALDPETLDEVMAAVLRRPEALVVIAHP